MIGALAALSPHRLAVSARYELPTDSYVEGDEPQLTQRTQLIHALVASAREQVVPRPF